MNFDSLLLISKINLKITEEDFWKYSPRKLFSLMIEYNKMNNSSKENKEKEEKEKNTISGDQLKNMLM